MSTEYTKTNWQDGDIITADKMNNIENGVKGIEGDVATVKDGLTAVEDDVADVKEDFSKYDNGTKTLPANWARGIIVLDSSQTIGIKFDASVKYRVSTLEPITLDAGTVITIKEGFRAILFRKVASTGKYTSTTPWLTVSYTVPSDVECYAVVGRLTDVTSEQADVYTFSSALQIPTNVQRDINKIGMMLPNADVVKFTKEGNNIQIITNFNGSALTVTGRITQTDVTNDAFDLYNYSGAFSKTADDDICPIYYNGSYRCAGHGNLVAFNLTATGHGKTVSDIGKVYTGETSDWILIKIVDTDHVWVVSEITSEATRPFKTTMPSTGTLTNSTGNIVYTAATLTQIRPQNINRSYTILVGDVPVINDGIYEGNRVVLTETYQSLNCVAMVAYLKDHVGSNTNESYYDSAIGGDVEYSVSYIFSADSSCCVSETITVLRDNIDISFVGIVQAQSYGTIGYVPFTSYDTPQQISGTWTFNTASWKDADFPPYKYYQFASGLNTAFAVGYDITVNQGKPENRKSLIADGGNYNGSSRKMYPKYLGKGLVASKGFKVSGNAFRCPVVSNSNGFGYTWQTKDAIFVEIESFSAGLVTISLPSYAVGKNITVVHASDTIAVNDSIVANTLMKVVTSGNGSATLKIQ